MTAMCGLARNYTQLFFARVGVGIGEATLTPSALSILSDYFPPEKRGAAVGCYNMGVSVGAGIAFMAKPFSCPLKRGLSKDLSFEIIL